MLRVERLGRRLTFQDGDIGECNILLTTILKIKVLFRLPVTLGWYLMSTESQNYAMTDEVWTFN